VNPSAGHDQPSTVEQRRSVSGLSGDSGHRRLRILTWHVHGAYLYYFAHCGHEIILPVGDGYAGLTDAYRWPANVRDVPADEVRDLELDAIVFQSRKNWVEDQHRILSAEQRRLPRAYIEHDPPREHPTDTRHVVDDPSVLLVHVTNFNDLMWDSGSTPTRVIDHGVVIPDGVSYTGELERGIVVINELARRGRRLGADIFERARQAVPLDLVGMRADELGGIGELAPMELPAFVARYRFFFNPIRYTSLGLGMVEAMAVGLPVIGFATTEQVTVIQNGRSGYLATDLPSLLDHMRRLLADPEEARRLGIGAREVVRSRFGIERFARDWDETLRTLVEHGAAGAARGT
jgi:hypothetical protein